VTSGDWFLVAWTALVGGGMGLALSTAADGALGALSSERSGVGSALMQAVQKIGGPFSAAILGSVLNSVYREHLNVAGLPAQAADAVQKSVFGGLAVARQIGAAPLLDSVRAAFVSGMDVALWVCSGVAAAGIVLALLFLPTRSHATGAASTIGTTEVEGIELGHEQVA